MLDTHALIWWLLNSPELSTAARKAIGAGSTRVLVSAASGWEMAIKYRLGKMPEAQNLIQKLPQYLRKERFEILPMTLAHSLAAGLLPGPHRDPFDRMLIAQAGLEKAQLVTCDAVFKNYDVAVLW